MQYRNTKQKTTILNAIDTYGHVTVEELKEILHNNNEDVSIATIYRNLNILAEEGKIKKVFSEDKAVFETIKKTHYHFECQLCHKIIDIDPSLINIKINHSITGVTKKDLFLYGICDECKNKENN